MNGEKEVETTQEQEALTVLEEGPTLPEVLTEDFVEMFNEGIERFKKFQTACFKLTRSSDWIKQGDRYYLQSTGAEALMNPLGINFGKPDFRKEEKKDKDGKPFYAYWCEGIMSSKTLGRSGYFIGYCDSKDQFFSANPKWNPETGEGDIKKSAYSNWLVNGVARIGGIRNPNIQTLQAAGIDPGKIAAPDYSGSKTPDAGKEFVTEPMIKRLWAICKAGGISEAALKDHLGRNYGVESTKEIKRSDYNAIVEWAEEVKADRHNNGGTNGKEGEKTNGKDTGTGGNPSGGKPGDQGSL